MKCERRQEEGEQFKLRSSGQVEKTNFEQHKQILE
jgi:hypothetical protein